MEIIGESMHIMNHSFLAALESNDQKALENMAKQQIQRGATALDVNLGQSKRHASLTPWVLETIQKQTDRPLFLSSHILKQPETCKHYRGPLVVNAVTANKTELTKAMTISQSNEFGLVVLLVSPEMTPSDVHGRLVLASQVMDIATQTGLSLSKIYLDPIISCRPDPTSWNLSSGLPDMNIIYESIALLKEMSGEWKTIAALSNTSFCLPSGERSAVHCRLLPLLAEAGLDAVILNCQDESLMAVCKGLPQRIVA